MRYAAINETNEKLNKFFRWNSRAQIGKQKQLYSAIVKKRKPWLPNNLDQSNELRDIEASFFIWHLNTFKTFDRMESENENKSHKIGIRIDCSANVCTLSVA